MNTISPSKTFNDPTWLDAEFPVLIIDDFLTQDKADLLVENGIDYIQSKPEGQSIIHGGRIMMPWTLPQFERLKESHSSWENFSNSFSLDIFELFRNKITSYLPEDSDLEQLKDEFLKSHIDYFDSYRLTKKLFNKDFYNKFQTAADFNIRKIKPKSLALVSFLRMMDSFYRRFLSITQFITNKKPIIPLFDYSFSNEGYAREIHRDSDNRLLVVLLYLNTLDEHAEGGDLEIYKIKSNELSNSLSSASYPAQPSHDQCTLQYKIKPRTGRLVMFLNQYNSYHAVSSMRNHSSGRHFIYGGFTYPSSIFNTKRRIPTRTLKTEMHIY